MTAMSLWEAAAKEMETYHFVAGAESQPKWDIPPKIAINVALFGRFEEGRNSPGHPTTL